MRFSGYIKTDASGILGITSFRSSFKDEGSSLGSPEPQRDLIAMKTVGRNTSCNFSAAQSLGWETCRGLRQFRVSWIRAQPPKFLRNSESEEDL